jgi:hypothetical protein
MFDPLLCAAVRELDLGGETRRPATPSDIEPRPWQLVAVVRRLTRIDRSATRSAASHLQRGSNDARA